MQQSQGFQITVTHQIKHDLRTPLNQIIGFAELLQEELAEGEQAAWGKDVGKINSAALHLLRALDELFDPENLQAEFHDHSPEAVPNPPYDPEAQPTAGQTPIEGRDSARFLVVDDNDKNRELLIRRLQQSGYAAVGASDGLEGLDLLEREGYDIVLLDVVMPGMGGMEVLRKIREKHSRESLPVIMTTAKDQTRDVIEALRLGANDYVTKPLNFAILLARSQTHLAMRRLSRLKDDFMQIASHDLKNPVLIITGANLHLEAQYPEAAKFTEMIRRNARIIQKIITNFLDFRALEDGQMQIHRLPVDINFIAQETLAANAAAAEMKGIALQAELDPSVPKVLGDALRLEQVLQNLVGNAIKFSDSAEPIMIRSRWDGGDAVIEVSDSGPGISDADMEKLFVKYARLSNQPTGGEKSSGLGLAICREIINLHGGRIGARNNLPRGATFWFRVPIGSGTPPE
ncbi:response regulator [Candidatus Sumerlaeota bacterium]|nr:response regulator [Candidatus Sumerlaeota bacterium]